MFQNIAKLTSITMHMISDFMHFDTIAFRQKKCNLKSGLFKYSFSVPAESVQAGREAIIYILTAICSKIWKTGKWPTTWTQSLVFTPRKATCSCARTTEPSALSAILARSCLKIILNRLQPQAEEIIAEEQAGFRAGRSTTEQIFNLRILCEKYLQHQQNLYHVFIDFKKAFDRVWHEALWATMRKYNINITRAIENLTRPRVQFCSMAAQENGSELQ